MRYTVVSEPADRDTYTLTEVARNTHKLAVGARGLLVKNRRPRIKKIAPTAMPTATARTTKLAYPQQVVQQMGQNLSIEFFSILPFSSAPTAMFLTLSRQNPCFCSIMYNMVFPGLVSAPDHTSSAPLLSRAHVLDCSAKKMHGAVCLRPPRHNYYHSQQ